VKLALLPEKIFISVIDVDVSSTAFSEDFLAANGLVYTIAPRRWNRQIVINPCASRRTGIDLTEMNALRVNQTLCVLSCDAKVFQTVAQLIVQI